MINWYSIIMIQGNPESFNHLAYLDKASNKAGLKHIRLHDSRHTHASIMLKEGVHPKIVQERLGHANIQITLDTYSHVVPGLQDAAAKRFDEAFTGRYNGKVEGHKSEGKNQVDDQNMTKLP